MSNKESPTPPVCCICRSRDVSYYCHKDPADYYSCRSCRGVFQYPVPSPDVMRDYANEQYERGLYREYVDEREMKLAHFQKRMALLAPHLRRGRLLDVGCSCGYFLEVAAQHGYDVYGAELSESAIAASRPEIRDRICQATIDQLSTEQEGRYQVVTAFDIIEHVSDPSEFIRHAKRLLVPHGTFVVATPDARHWLRYLMGSRWPMLQPMQHLAILSRHALRVALEEAGFESILIQTAYKTLSLQYLLNQVRLLNPTIYTTLTTCARPISRRFMGNHRQVNIGEMLAIAVKGD